MDDLSKTRWRRIERILDRALDLPPGERAGFLDKACAGRQELRAEVEALLSADGRPHHLLDGDLTRVTARLLGPLAGADLEDCPPAFEPGAMLAGYEILGRLGAGGAGEVYRARDRDLGREVAVKVLQSHVATDPARIRRFEREARAASALNHPNIVTIHGVGRCKGRRYIVMEYVEGETLRRLLGAGALPRRELLRLASQMAVGLSKAHAAGIVHRDLKPENVMVSVDGFVKILDFGLTKLMPSRPGELHAEVAGPGAGERSSGRSGTPAYMSPEQVRGEAVDFRSDQFSLGALLYEMAMGRPAFLRGTVAETVHAIVEARPEALPPRHIGSPLCSLIERCLAKEPGDRYPSTADVVRALLRLSDEGLGPDRSRAGGRLRAAGGEPRGDRAVIDSLAILPLVDLGDGPQQQFFADGMTEALIAGLSRIAGLRVISRTSVMRFRGADEPLPEIARKLDVEGLVEGSVLRADGRVRISARLVHGPTDCHLWARSYERDLADVLHLQGELAHAIAEEIHLRLEPQERARLEFSRCVDPGAHESYLLGRHYLNQRTAATIDRAVGHFERAIARAPDHAPAHCGLADALALLAGAGYDGTKQRLVRRAKAMATRALVLDEMLGEAHTSLGFLRFKFDWNWSGAERSFRRAIELSPSSATARHWYALFLSARGRHREAVAQIERARQLDPLSLIIRAAASRVLQFARDFEGAVEHARQALELDPDYAEAHFNLGMCYLNTDRSEDAVEELRRALRRSPERPLYLALLGNAMARSGRRAEARELLRRLRSLARERRASAVELAIVYTGLGEIERAFDEIEAALDDRVGTVVFMDADALMDDVRSHPRYGRCLDRLDLPRPAVTAVSRSAWSPR